VTGEGNSSHKGEQDMRRVFLISGVLGLASLLVGVPLAAAGAAKPAVERCDVAVTVQDGNAASVVAKYAILNPEALKDATVVLQMSDMPGVSVEGLKAAAADGKALETSMTKTPGFDKLMVKLPGEIKGPFNYTLEYTSKSTGLFRVPVFVPTFPVAQSVKSFFATVTLPPKMTFYGDEFPRAYGVAQKGDSTVVEISEVNIPSFIKVSFGPGSAPLITGSSVTTFFSLLFIIVAAYWWWHLKTRQFKAA
jgi:hypothetical protein